jgi:hypothetical protein
MIGDATSCPLPTGQALGYRAPEEVLPAIADRVWFAWRHHDTRIADDERRLADVRNNARYATGHRFTDRVRKCFAD